MAESLKRKFGKLVNQKREKKTLFATLSLLFSIFSPHMFMAFLKETLALGFKRLQNLLAESQEFMRNSQNNTKISVLPIWCLACL